MYLIQFYVIPYKEYKIDLKKANKEMFLICFKKSREDSKQINILVIKKFKWIINFSFVWENVGIGEVKEQRILKLSSKLTEKYKFYFFIIQTI